MRRTGIERVGIVVGLGALLLGVPALAQYREYYVRGRVVDTKKQPVPEVAIEVREVATSRSYHLKTGKDGTFKLAGLPHGTYKGFGSIDLLLVFLRELTLPQPNHHAVQGARLANISKYCVRRVEGALASSNE